jgi:hypothetical protein
LSEGKAESSEYAWARWELTEEERIDFYFEVKAERAFTVLSSPKVFGFGAELKLESSMKIDSGSTRLGRLYVDLGTPAGHFHVGGELKTIGFHNANWWMSRQPLPRPSQAFPRGPKF